MLGAEDTPHTHAASECSCKYMLGAQKTPHVQHKNVEEDGMSVAIALSHKETINI